MAERGTNSYSTHRELGGRPPAKASMPEALDQLAEVSFIKEGLNSVSADDESPSTDSQLLSERGRDHAAPSVHVV